MTLTREQVKAISTAALESVAGGFRMACNDAPIIIAICDLALKGLEAAHHTEAKETVAQWMIKNSHATGHGDTIEDLLGELERGIEHGVSRARSDALKTAAQIADKFGEPDIADAILALVRSFER